MSRKTLRLLRLLLLSALTGFAFACSTNAQQPPTSAKWEAAIAAFEKQDKEHALSKNGIVFVGSSTIRFWDLKKSFPGLNALNRGFGGSELGDSVHFLQRLVLKHEPRLVVLYAGDNDLAAGKSPEKVAADFEAFAAGIHKELPRTKIVFISIKPSIKRWELYGKIQKANGLIEAYCKQDDRRVFVDITPMVLGKDGKPLADLFRADGLHFNDKGYEQLSKVIEPNLHK
jgi:lysophospholipase L1-like esterase